MDSPVMQFSPEPDAGTPRVSGAAEVTVTIDGHSVSVAAGTSIMRAAFDAGIQVPKLCASDQLDSYGSCRVCLVQVEGRRGLPASCTTVVEPGMVVHTQGEQLARVRRNVVELYVADHPLDCDTCAADGDCELQSVAADVGVHSSRYAVPGEAASAAPTDTSNPYFEFDPNLCIQCSRCVRACEDIQGTYALTMEGRGPETRVVAGTDQPFFESDCVSCGACVSACPTGSLLESSVIRQGTPAQVVETTCAYCGVGCSFRAEVRDEQVIRMVPSKSGGANAGHACVKGRFAWGYANHAERVLAPLIRETSSDEWTEVDWDTAIDFAARKLTDIRTRYGAQSIGGISSSRCTNEEVFVVQKMVRAAFGNNNIDTCARVCHSPTGYGLKQTFGTSAGTQDFASVGQADVVLLIGANPTDAHPVFASRMKKRLRAGAELIVVDPRRIDLVRTPHIEASHHLAVVPGANVALMNALAHVVVSEGLCNEDFVRQRCDAAAYQAWLNFITDACHAPEQTEQVTGVPASAVRAAARLYARAPNAAIYYGLGVTEHSQGSTMVMCMANLAMATGNIGRDGVGVNPLRGQNNVQGACDMGSFPHELPGYRHITDAATRSTFESDWQVRLDPEPGLRIPNMFSQAGSGAFKGMFIQGEDVAQSDPDTLHVQHALGSLECLIVQDLFLNETAQFAHVFLPGTSFLEKDGTFTNAERRINRVRPVTEPRTGLSEWEVVCRLGTAMGYPMGYASASEIMDEIARLTPTFAGVSFAKLDRLGSVQWPCPDLDSNGTRTMHKDRFVRGEGQFVVTEYVPTDERTNRRYPLILTTGRILSQYNVGAQTRRTDNMRWHERDKLEIHLADAELRGITSGDSVMVSSRKGSTALVAEVTDRVPPGVVHTTFHHPDSQANVLTTEFSDWATNCPEYKVTAVQVVPGNEFNA